MFIGGFARLQAGLQIVPPCSYLYEHMFPPLLHLLRNAAIRYADLALALLTLDAVRLPDRLFAPAAAVDDCTDAGRSRQGHRVAGATPRTTEARDRRSAPASTPGALRPLSAAACAHTRAPRTPNFTTAARRGAAATESRASGMTFPVSTRRR